MALFFFGNTELPRGFFGFTGFKGCKMGVENIKESEMKARIGHKISQYDLNEKTLLTSIVVFCIILVENLC